MSKKNKRYLLCSYSGYTSWYGYEREPYWYSRRVDRDGLVLAIAKELKYDSEAFKYFTDDTSKIPERVTYTPYYERAGVKSFKSTYHKVFCVKVIKDGKEYPVDLKALRKDVVSRLEELSKPKKRSYHRWSWGHSSWKDQNKCKHQWEIHQRKRVYVSDYNPKDYDSSWEEVS